LSFRVRACAAPVFVTVAGRNPTADAQGLQRLAARVDQMLSWLGGPGRFRDENQRPRMANVYLSARQRLQEKLAAVSPGPTSP
jgi:hypothetical protein